MNNTQLQAMFDGLSAMEQHQRAQSQMTLGRLIEILESFEPDKQVANIGEAHSYRGYYSDLAFEKGDGTRPAKDLLQECKNAMGQVFQGYKGGDYVMGALTPLWIANYGECGEKLLAIGENGGLETAEDN